MMLLCCRHLPNCNRRRWRSWYWICVTMPAAVAAAPVNWLLWLLPGITADATWVIFEGNRYEGKRKKSANNAGILRSNNAEEVIFGSCNAGYRWNAFYTYYRCYYSAAELVVSRLKPYIREYLQIGALPERMKLLFTIRDYRVPKRVMWRKYNLLYIKLFNSNSQGHIARGINPLYPVSEIDTIAAL